MSRSHKGRGRREHVKLIGVLCHGTCRSSAKNHHYNHPIITHEWSFLPGEKSHYHTMKAGQHVFPFNFTFPGNLPSSIRTYLNDADITYKLKATAHRSAFQHNFHAAKNVTVLRGFTNEALEYNQTLEIENTWPGKVMYCLTLPHKAYAAGDEIPVSVKFMPLAKGTRVTHITSVIKEYTLVHTRHSSHPEVRVAATCKHELKEGRAFRVTERGSEPVAPAHHFQGAGGDFHGMNSAPPSAPPSPRHGPTLVHGHGHASGAQTPMSDFSLSRAGSFANLTSLAAGAMGVGSSTASSQTQGSGSAMGGGSGSGGYFGLGGGGRTGAGAGASSAAVTPMAGPSATGQVAAFPDDMRERGDEEDILIGDEEIDTMITIPVPSWTTPSHNIHPVFVTHKIKWSCAISNPDGHVSELRCALPIHILPHALLEESQTATSSTRALLFGGMQEETTHVDLPSYNDHVYDRIANANNQTPTSGYVSAGHRTPGSGGRTPASGGATPAGSRAPSRPGSPVLRAAATGGLPTPGGMDITDGFHPVDDIPPRPELGWADSELMMSLGALAPHQGSNPNSRGGSPHDTPPDSRGPSRPTSRLGFRSGRNSAGGSRAGSRASSPERPSSTGTVQANNSSLANGTASIRRPLHERRPSLGVPGGLFNLASVKPFTAMMGKHHGSHSVQHSPKLQATQGSSNLPRNGFSLGSHAAFTNLAESQANARGENLPGSGPGSGSTTAAHTPSAQPVVDPLSQVPSYEVARVGFLGGGVTPLSAAPPDYADSDRFERAKSETDLTQLARDHAVQGTSLAAMLENLDVNDSTIRSTPNEAPL